MREPALYRCYVLDKDRHILKVEVVESATDEEALQRVDELCSRMTNDWLAVEIWHRARLVITRWR